MTKVFLDTAAWIALINVDDDFHQLAKQVRIELQQDNCSLVTSDFVLLEVIVPAQSLVAMARR